MFNTASALLGPGHCVQMFIQACWLLADNTLQHPQEEKVAQNRCTAKWFFSDLLGKEKFMQSLQGGRSRAKPRVAFAEKFGLRRKF